ncbi:hypothetical protein KFK09_009242 [Dendrobium nobile]|uniref:Uncharacterized protein n=1 Tax=Dendrobium nobile TaxID=94219 RepID=A0A8T3BQF2_DENNO|nr:hypothetical protein KFK09_009242 [Dendrobium nobile]
MGKGSSAVVVGRRSRLRTGVGRTNRRDEVLKLLAAQGMEEPKPGEIGLVWTTA